MTGFAFSVDDIGRALQAREAAGIKGAKDGRVCKCGHPGRTHTSESSRPEHIELREQGRFACKPGRQQCPCQKFDHVMITDDARMFLQRTEGPAELHALAKGVYAAAERGVKVSWVPGTQCDGCHQDGKLLYPLAVDRVGREVRFPSVTNILLCVDCRTRLAQSFVVDKPGSSE